jgi:acetyl esterase/lipase
MLRFHLKLLGCCLAAAGLQLAGGFGSLGTAAAADASNYTRQEDVIYGRKFGTALTMDVFTPKDKPNGAAIVVVVSGGFFSSHEAISPFYAAPFLKRGYTVFTVVHGSQPKYTIPEIVGDMNRSIRFIRSKADAYHIDKNRIGITGGSAGGHLSLMQGTAGTNGDPAAKDPVERESSRVQAVACLYPPTDFLNYGKPGEVALGNGTLKDFKAPFDFTRYDPQTKSFELITDQAKRQEIGKQISPIYQVSSDDPPTLIVHGDADTLVPIQQSQTFVEKMKASGVTAELTVKKGAGHGWGGMEKELEQFADWFDKYLTVQP